MTPRQRFGSELRRWRNIRGLSQFELGKRVHRDKSVISRIEAGKRPVDIAFARACDHELDTDGALIALVPAESPASANKAVPLRELGLPPAPGLIGREEYTDEIARALAAADAPARSAQVCVLRGMAGVGKTALALSVAHELGDLFPDGRVYRDMTGDTAGLRQTTAAELLEWLLRHLRVDANAMPATLTDRAALFQGRTRDTRILLVLDNVRDVAQVISAIPATANCAVLITTRHRLPSLSGARHIDVAPLTDRQALDLLRRLVPTTDTAARHDRTVEQILRRCGNLPLAIHVVAGMYRRKPHLGLEGVREHLLSATDRLRALSDGERDVSLMLRTALADLGSPEYRLFVLLALYPGQLVMPRIAAALADTDESAARELLDRLWDRHLLMPGPRGSYRVHDLLRELATEELRALTTTDRAAALRRLIGLHLADADSADRLVSPHRNRRALPDGVGAGFRFRDPAAALAWLHANESGMVSLARSAIEHGFDEYCWHLAHILRGYFFLACRFDAWIATHEVALVAAERSEDRWWEATTRGNLGLAFALGGDIPRADAQYRRAQEIFQALDDVVNAGHTLGHQSWTAHVRGDYPAAVELARAALAVYRREGLTRNAAIMMREIGASLTAMGRFDEARDNFDEAIVRFRALELDLDLAMALNNLADLYLTIGEPHIATTFFAEAVELARDCGAPGARAQALRGLGDAGALRGEHERARAQWSDALELMDEFALPGAEELRCRLREDRQPVPALSDTL